MSQSGFLWSGRGESRERGLPPKEIYLRLRSNKHVQTWLFAPPLITTTKWCFFSRPRILLSKKQKKTKKKQKSWWTCNNNLYFSTHARTRTRVNMSSAVSDSARVVRLFISSLFVRALRARERGLSAEEELCNVVPDDPPGWILSLSMGLSPSSSSAIRSRPDMS